MIFGFPVQWILIMIMIKQRQKGVKITDTRMRLTTEVRLWSRCVASPQLVLDFTRNQAYKILCLGTFLHQPDWKAPG
jgi:hypothetical protein